MIDTVGFTAFEKKERYDAPPWIIQQSVCMWIIMLVDMRFNFMFHKSFF